MKIVITSAAVIFILLICGCNGKSIEDNSAVEKTIEETTYEPTDEELRLFKEATQDIVLKFIHEGMNNKSLLDKLMTAAEDAQ